jgi:hypothetical protein
MEQVGMGPVNFVNSVNKYYLAFNRERAALSAWPALFDSIHCCYFLRFSYQ